MNRLQYEQPTTNTIGRDKARLLTCVVKAHYGLETVGDLFLGHEGELALEDAIARIARCLAYRPDHVRSILERYGAI